MEPGRRAPAPTARSSPQLSRRPRRPGWRPRATTATPIRRMPMPPSMIEAVYEVPYLAHAPMEPLNATVHYRPDRLDVWIGTQNALSTLTTAAKAAGPAAGQGLCPQLLLRRRLRPALVQRRDGPGDPRVKGDWQAGEADLDPRGGYSRTTATARRRRSASRPRSPPTARRRPSTSAPRSARCCARSAAARSQAASSRWRSKGSPTRPYAVASTRVDCALKNTHIPVSFWRSVGSSQNAFAIESFIDEMAHAAGQDPYQFRRKLLVGRTDFLKVLDTLAEKSDWGETIAGRERARHRHSRMLWLDRRRGRRGRGEARARSRSNGLSLALDCGHAVNPLTVAEQIEGGAIWGLSAALYGKITVKNGAIVETNFDSYPVVRMARSAEDRDLSRAQSAARSGVVSANRARRRSRPPSPMRSLPPPASASASYQYAIAISPAEPDRSAASWWPTRLPQRHRQLDRLWHAPGQLGPNETPIL